MRRLVLYLRHNGISVLLALFLSWMLWFQVSSFFVETKRVEVTVNVFAEDASRILLLGHGPEKVTLEITGNRRLIDRIDAATFTADFRVRTEFLDEDSGRVQTLTFTEDDLELPRDLDLRRMEPPEISVTFAPRKASDVGVKVDVDTSQLERVAPDLKYLGAVAWPEKIEIEGPKKIVEEVNELRTTKIQIEKHVGRVPEPPMAPEFSLYVPLDLKALEARGVRADDRGVNVLLRFAWAFRRDVEIPVEVHWVDPDPAAPVTVKIDESLQVSARDDKLWLKVTLLGPKKVVEDAKVVAAIRAYVRTDEVLKQLEGGIPRVPAVHFEGLPPGVTVEPIAPENLPHASKVEFKSGGDDD